MKQQRWLVAWIGYADLEAAEGKRPMGEVGPVAMALLSKERYQRVHLLTNHDADRSNRYYEWLASQVTYARAEIHLSLTGLELENVINLNRIYEVVIEELKAASLPRDDVDLTFHLTPGTSAMSVIWTVLGRTLFPARLIQTSRESGGVVEEVDFSDELASAFLPKFLGRSNARINRLADKQVAPEFSNILHSSDEMRLQIERAQHVAMFDVPVLILGETGTGKELFASAIHATSTRASKKLIPVNCGSLSRELANSELFGHKEGAFTGATHNHNGYFREADGSTLFLDEIGDLPLDSQVRLLRALQSNEVTPVGATRPVKIDVRIVAATHRDLAAEVSAGRFREDLYHRLAVGILRLPALRDRGSGDLRQLIDDFLKKINADSAGRLEAQHKTLSADAERFLMQHSWPGNIRELYSTLFRASIWSRGSEISELDVRDALLPSGPKTDGSHSLELGQGVDLNKIKDDISRMLVPQAWIKSGYHQGNAAKLLGLNNPQTFVKLAKDLCIQLTKPTVG